MRLFFFSTLLGVAAAFTLHSTLRPVRLHAPLSVRMDEGEDRMKSFQEMRERARLRSEGAPQKEWAKLSDPEDTRDGDAEKPDGQDGYRPPTEEEVDAANQLFETMLSGKAPDGFGDGVEDYLATEDKGSWTETDPEGPTSEQRRPRI